MNHRINFEVNGNNEIYSEWSHNIYGTGISANISSEMGEEMNFSLVLNLSKTGNSTSVNGKEYNGYEISLYEWKSDWILLFEYGSMENI